MDRLLQILYNKVDDCNITDNLFLQKSPLFSFLSKEVDFLKLFSNTFTSLEQALNYSSLKQKVISQNIANVDTPNYKAKDVSFQSILQNEMSQNQNFTTYRTDSRHIDFSDSSPAAPVIVTRPNVQYNNDGNSVDLDQEMSDLAKNQIYYDALVEQENNKFSALQDVISGGK
jgi:flagellar basal-body rod protein FlgB